jgi:hypothetical protein
MTVAIGDVYGYLTVLEVERGHDARARVRCICGTEKTISRGNLRGTRSCGCQKSALVASRMTHHGLSNSPEYRSWRSMKSRVTNPRNPDWHRYGGRGITACQEWLDSFETFLSDMGPRPIGMTLDRIDTEGNYEPGNCRWTDAKTQANNKTRMRGWKVLCRHRSSQSRAAGQQRTSRMGFTPSR